MILWLQNIGNAGADELQVVVPPEQEYVDSNEPTLVLDSKDCRRTMEVYPFIPLEVAQFKCTSFGYQADTDFIVGEILVGEPHDV